MNFREQAVQFACEQEALIGILTLPDTACDTGVLIVVGGPQTRVGSHRQFVLLSRALATAGYPTLRFDYRGMGDSTGATRNFEATEPDITAAIDTLYAARPTLRRVILWGLCDAAAAALLYWDSRHDPRVAGFCLLNPWLRSETTLARAQVKHYYGQRLLQKTFWLKLLGGKLNIAQAVGGLFAKLRQASTKVGDSNQPQMIFQDRMARALREFPGPSLLLLSENDYTAKEFLEYANTAASWRGLLAQPNLTRVDIEAADHTFSSAAWRNQVEQACLDWLAQTVMRAEK